MAKDYTVTSPNGKNVATVDDSLSITVSHSGKTVVTVKARQDFVGNKKLVETKHISETIVTPFYRQSEIRTEGNQMDLKLSGGFGLQVRLTWLQLSPMVSTLTTTLRTTM